MNRWERAPRAYDPSLDGIRAVAVALVMVGHFTDDSPGVPAVIRAFTGAGWIGVDVFFVLSGFLITGICIDNAGPGFLRTFYLRRALRIVPPYAAVLSLTLLGDAVFSAHSVRNVWALATFTTNIVAAWTGYWSSLPQATWHFWSLAVEEQFYVLWPWALVLLSRRSAWTIALAAIPSALLIRCALISARSSPLAPYVLMPARMDSLAAGATLAMLLRDPALRASVRHALRKVAGCPVRWWVAALLTFCAAVSAITHDAGPFSPAMATVGYTTIAAAAALTVAAVAFAGELTPLRRVLSKRYAVTIGRYSYAMYLVHVPVNVALRSAGFVPAGAVSAVVFTLCASGVTFGLAAASWRFVEAPVLSLKRYAPYRGIPEQAGVGKPAPRRAPEAEPRLP